MKEKKLSVSLTDNRFGGWGWSMIIYCMLLYFFVSALKTDGMNLIPDAFAGAYGWSSTTLLAFTTPASIIGLIGGFIFGRLIIKTGPRMISSVTLIISGVMFAILGMSGSVAMYVVSLMLVCFFAAGFGNIACPAFMANWFPRKKGIALGWASMGAPLSTAGFVSGFSVLLAKCGIKTAFLLTGIVVVIVGIISFFWAKNDPSEVGCLPDNMALDGSRRYFKPVCSAHDVGWLQQ